MQRRLRAEGQVIFDELTRPGATWMDTATLQIAPVPENIRRCATESVRVSADEPWQWYWQSEEDVWDFSGHRFGPLRLPFASMWVEGELPKLIHADGEWQPRLYERTAAFLYQGRPGPGCPPGTDLTIIGQQFVKVESRPVFITPASALLFLRSDGTVVDHKIAYAPDNEYSAALYTTLSSELKAAFLAISLMNCKNVALEHHEGIRKTTKKQRRPRPASLDYHTIKLPRPANKSTAAKRAAVGDIMPFHMVRGHFKTFTADAPLLGQHVGTYWWGWQTRGNKQNGIVVTDYEVSR